MPCVTIQFHMLFDELIGFVEQLKREFKFRVELESFCPKTILLVSPDEELTRSIDNFGHVDRLWLLYRPPRCKKYERFNLNVGRQKGNMLEQSHLGAGTDRADAFKILQKVASRLKKRTTPGVWVVTETGSVGIDKTFRLSSGAADAERNGQLRLTSFGFTQSFHADRPKPIQQGRKSRYP